MRSSPKTNNKILQQNTNSGAMDNHQAYQLKAEQDGGRGGGDLVSHEEFESILSFENLNNAAWDKSTGDSMPGRGSQAAANDDKVHVLLEKNKPRSDSNTTPPLSFLEKWLLDESAGQVEEMMELSPMF
jgi:myb proto-oncogene protein